MAWYWIGVLAGLGSAVGVLAAALLAGVRFGAVAAAAVAVVAAAVLGLAIGGWGEAVGGVLGAIAGVGGAAQLVAGTLRRGGTRAGTAAFVALAAVLLAALAWVPVLGYLEALALPALGARLRSRAPRRYAGLRILD